MTAWETIRRGVSIFVALMAAAPPSGAQPGASAIAPYGIVVRPAANGRGWHNAPVTIAFPCADAASGADCRPPVVMDRDGTGQRLDIRAAGDHSSVVVNIDRTPPTVSLVTPVDGTSTALGHVEVSGHVSDSLSGLSWAACNGARAQIVGDIVRCSVALSPGINAVVLHAMDLAGNSASAAARVIRLTPSGPVSVVPASMTIAIDGAFGGSFAAMTEAGVSAAGVTWTTDSPDVVTLKVEGDSAHVTPRAAGAATLTARLGNRTSSATITVVDGYETPAGATNWAIAPLAGRADDRVLHTPYSNDLNVVAALVTDGPANTAVVRTVSMLGDGAREVWRAHIDGRPLTIDRAGGIISLLDGPGAHGLVRYDGPGGGPLWRFDSDWSLSEIDSDEQGRIYVVEATAEGTPTGDALTRVAIVDAATGQPITRVPLPESTLVEVRCDGTRTMRPQASSVGALLGLDEGVLATVMTSRITQVRGCVANRPVPGGGRLELARSMTVVLITTDGVAPMQTLWEWRGEGPDTTDFLRAAEDAVAGPAIPTMSRELLILWRHVTGAGDATLHLSRATPDRLVDVVPIAAGRPWRTMLIDVFQEPRVLLDDGGALHAIDMDSGRTKWRTDLAARPVLASNGGHVIVNDERRGELVELDDEGRLVRQLPFRLRDAEILSRDSGVIHGFDQLTGAFVELAIELDTLASAYGVLDLGNLPTSSAWINSLRALVR